MRRRVDYGSLIILLIILILSIFGVDVLRKKIAGWRGSESPLVVNSILNEKDQPREQKEAQQTAPPQEDKPAEVTTTSTAFTTVALTTAAAKEGFRTESVSIKNVHKGSLILVDAKHSLDTDVECTPFDKIKYDHFRLPSRNLTIANETITPLVNLFNAFFKSTSLGNVMVYATMNTPTAAAYSAAIPERASGLTMDLGIWNQNNGSHKPYTATEKYAWIAQHAHEYGYVQRYPAGKEEITGQKELTWHYRYVGIPHAKYMTDNKLCLEEYLEQIKKYTFEGEHLHVAVGDLDYEIYYVPVAESGFTKVNVPESSDYSISGNNTDGVIVSFASKSDSTQTQAATTTTAPAET